MGRRGPRLAQARTMRPVAFAVTSFALLALACSATSGGPGVGSSGGSHGDNGDDGDTGKPGDRPLVGVNDTDDGGATAQGLKAGDSLETTADLNLRKGPGTSYAIIVVIPSGSVVAVVDLNPQNGFVQITWSGNTGWSSLQYLAAVTKSSTDPNGPPSPSNAIARAQASVGFSYYWGGGAWLASGPTSSTAGSCSGNCPSCTHSGTYGADCSGMVGKAWQFGTLALDVNSHPYSTASFVNDVAGKWSTVSRGSLKAGDALVYNSGGEGHIVLFESGDGWGSSTVYECKGCSYGCVHDTRTFSSAYHGIRRAGF